MIKICKITRAIYSVADFHLLAGWCGEKLIIVYRGKKPPKPLKTVDYKLVGEFEKSKKHGKQFIIESYEKIGSVKIQTNVRRDSI